MPNGNNGVLQPLPPSHPPVPASQPLSNPQQQQQMTIDRTGGLLDVSHPPSKLMSICSNKLTYFPAQEFGQNLENLDLTNIAGWDLEAFWNF